MGQAEGNRLRVPSGAIAVPTIFSHIAVPLALRAGLGPRAIPRPLLLAGMAASVIPDLDVIGFQFGVHYGTQFGHRGATHSIAFALALGAVALWWPFTGERFFAPWRPIEVSPLSAARFLSHRGLEVLGSELVWVWLPAALFAALLLALRGGGAAVPSTERISR